MEGKDKLISKDMRKLKKQFAGIPEDRRILADKLIYQIAFMGATIGELQEAVNREGPTIKTVNGNGFKTTQEHPAQRSYNTMIKNYLAAMKQLCDMLPDPKTEGAEKAGEKLKEFIQAGKR